MILREKLEILSLKKDKIEIKNDIEKISCHKLSINHPIFDIDFDKEESK